jgi:hypothetical protein
MSRAAYYKTKCSICGADITTNGIGKASHMKKHIRAGEGFAVVVESRNSREKTTTTYYPMSVLERHQATEQRKLDYLAAGMTYRVVDQVALKAGMGI